MSNGKLKLRAFFALDIVTDSYAAAGEHEKRLLGFHAALKEAYPEATITIREFRERQRKPGSGTARPPDLTGALVPYA